VTFEAFIGYAIYGHKANNKIRKLKINNLN
jgi:hypothetical protein